MFFFRKNVVKTNVVLFSPKVLYELSRHWHFRPEQQTGCLPLQHEKLGSIWIKMYKSIASTCERFGGKQSIRNAMLSHESFRHVNHYVFLFIQFTLPRASMTMVMMGFGLVPVCCGLFSQGCCFRVISVHAAI